VSHVLQWNTNAPDFSASSNSFWLNVTVWLWSFGQTISKSMRSLMSLPLTGQSSACDCSNSSVYPHGSACLFPSDPTAILSIRRSRSIMRLVIALLFLVLHAVGQSVEALPKTVEVSLVCTNGRPGLHESGAWRGYVTAKHHRPPSVPSTTALPRRRVVLPGVSWLRWECPPNGCMNRV
jgi:hypothetical protein